MEPSLRELVRAGLLASAVSGLPSTMWAIATGQDPFAATRAAGTLLPGRRGRPSLVGGMVVHIGISAFWTAVFGLVARHRRLGAVQGVLAGLGIAALDLGVLGRRYPAIARLPKAPQWADHVLFGAVLGHVLRSDRSGPT